MTVARWLVRYDGTPTTGARVGASLVVLAAFLGGFAVRSHGEQARTHPPAPALAGRLAADAAAHPAAAVRLRSAAAVPPLRTAPRAHRAHPGAAPSAVVVKQATPAPRVTSKPVALLQVRATPRATPAPAAPVAPVAAPAPAPAPAPRPAPRPAAPRPTPGPVFDSSG